MGTDYRGPGMGAGGGLACSRGSAWGSRRRPHGGWGEADPLPGPRHGEVLTQLCGWMGVGGPEQPAP